MAAGRKSKKELNEIILDESGLNKAKKIKYDAERLKQVSELERLKKEKLQGLLIELKLVQESFTTIATKTKSDLYRLISILPPKLIGLNTSDMSDVIRDSIDEVLTSLYNGFTVAESEINYDAEPELEEEEDEE